MAECDYERALKLASEARLAALEARVHPHFLFNTLNTVSALIPNAPDRAERLIERLAALLRFSLDSPNHGLVPPDRDYVIDHTITHLEARLDPSRFVRIHRGVILNLDHLLDLHASFGGRMVARVKGPARTELTVSRDRVRALKAKLGL